MMSLLRCGMPILALCYGLITFANKYLPATVVSAFWPVQVPVAVILASCWAGIFAKPDSDTDGPFCETITKMELLGGVLIAAGLLAVTYSDHMERKEEEQKRRDMPPLLSGTHTLLPSATLWITELSREV